MTKRFRLLIASIGIAAAAATGTILAVGLPAVPPDTTWGSHASEDDTTWGTAPADPVEDPAGPVVTPQDTTWG